MGSSEVIDKCLEGSYIDLGWLICVPKNTFGNKKRALILDMLLAETKKRQRSNFIDLQRLILA